ncbi:MAG: 6,7-dimethyl-8-ribityllumazine synthase [Corynebacterium sp.]|nr:6,7-dimethyl-8-ribityllumazine synthase [Corynebacterium sp.]
MSSSGNPTMDTLGLDAAAVTDLRVAVITSTWNEEITDRLHAHAVARGRELGATVDEYRVVGALEIPVVTQALARTGTYDALVACGCVIRGDTPHFDYVARLVNDGLLRVQLDEQLPIGNGVLTTNTEEQAIVRSGVDGGVEDKGADAMSAALHTCVVVRSIARAR